MRLTGNITLGKIPNSVSYTHLDVYKRQGLVYADTLNADLSSALETYVSVNDEKMPDDMKNTTGVLSYHDAQIPCCLLYTSRCV